MHYLGIDWATDKHDVCLLAEDGRIVREFSISHDLVGFEELHTVLHAVEQVKVNIERSDGLLVEWLLSGGYEVCMTPPSVLAHRRPRRSKDDRGDAYLLAYLLRVGDKDCRPICQQGALVTQLKQLSSAYDTVLHEQRCLTNRLIYILRQYYPAILRAFSVPNSLICLDFLSMYPTPEAAQTLSLAQVEAFLKAHHYSFPARIASIHTALSTPAPRARVTAGFVSALRILLPTLRALHQERARLTREMQALFNTHPDAAFWRSFPGTTGPLTPARLLAWIGDNRQRFPSAAVLQATAGTAPITRRSGKHHAVEFRRSCSHPLRKALDDLARQSVKHSTWAAGYFRDQLSYGHSRPRAYRALANRWAAIIWKLWQTNCPYDEAKHLANCALKRLPNTVAAAA